MRITKVIPLLVGMAMAAANSFGQGSTYSIGLKFAVDDSGSGSYSLTNLPPSAVAGLQAVAQANWNLLAGNSSNSASQLSAVVDKTGAPSGMQVSWSSAVATWRSVGGNMANFFSIPSPNNALLSTYLDIGNTGTNLVNFTSIPSALTSGKYDVYVYMGSDTGGRGGRYTLIDGATGAPLATNLFVTATSSTNYVQDPGTTQTGMTGNYIVFRGISSSSITLQATTSRNAVNGTPRTPISAIQLVAQSSAGEPAPATGLTLSSSAGTGKITVSWTTNAGTVGSLVVVRAGFVETAVPVDGTTYSANSVFGQGQDLGDNNTVFNAGNFVVYSGPGTSVTVTGLTPLIVTNYVAVYTYSTTGANPNYTLASIPTASAAATGTLLSVTNNLPLVMYTNGISPSSVLATFDVGAPVDVTAAATYASSATNVLAVSAAGVVTGVGNTASNTATITTTFVAAGVTNRSTTTILVIAPPTPVLKHRYSFNADPSDSVGGANGVLQGSAAVTGGQLVLDGNAGSYLDIGAVQDLSNYTAITWEMWVTDNGTSIWGRIFDFGNFGGHNMWLSPPSATVLRATYDINNAGEQQINPTVRPAIGAKTHIVVTTDGATRRGVMYLNGLQVGINTGMTLTPASHGLTTNNWLGRSQYSADPYFIGSYDEFRIWQNAMQPFQVAVNFAAGPNTVPPADLGAASAVHLTLPFATAGLGGRQQVTATVDYASVSGVNATTVGIVSYSSTNTSVATIDANGNIRALSAGTTLITATVAGKSDSQVLTVVFKPTLLAHRYSFSESPGSTTLADSVAGKNASYEPGFGAGVGGGVAVCDGVASYIQMPAGLITNYENVTIETWALVDPANVNSANGRLFSIGSVAGVNEIGLVPASGALTRARFWTATGTLSDDSGGEMTALGNVHTVAIFDPNAGRIDLFINGVWRNSFTNLINPLNQIVDALGILGANISRSQFTAATYDEFRIWQGALNRSAVAASFAAGPNNANNAVLAGTVPSSVSLRVDPTMIAGERQLPQVRASYTGFAAPADYSGHQGTVSYFSSDPTVIRVNTTALAQPGVFTNSTFEAVAPGTANVWVSVGGVSNAPVTVTVLPVQTMLVHRYNFNEPAASGTAAGLTVHDLVGVQDGTIWGLGSSLTGTKVQLAPLSANDKNSYVELPSGLVGSFDAATFELWFTPGAHFQAFDRVFDFGSYVNASGVSYVFFTTDAGTPPSQGRVAILTPEGGEQNTSFNASPTILTMDTNGTWHVAVVYNQPGNFLGVYTNGVLARSTTISRHLRSVDDIKCWLGRSLFSGDGQFIGSFDEFRLYSGALSAAQIAANFAAGPNTVPSLPPSLSMQASGANLVFRWQSGTGFNLKSSTSLQPNSGYSNVAGTPTTQGGLNVQTIPAPAATTFYLLGKP